jgi:erythromycin esterase-like protein
MRPPGSQLAERLADVAQPLTETGDRYDRLLDRIGDAKFVLIGEATHGTHEFYAHRAEITKRLVAEKGFVGIAIEGDWPDAARVHRYATGQPGDSAPEDALGSFKRFPAWMWRNEVLVDFVRWLRGHNEPLSAASQTGFYGLDLYSLHGSIAAILEYLDKVDPDAARRARARYSCFDHFGGDPQAYGRAAALDLSKSCEQDVVRQLVEIRRNAAEYLRRDGRLSADDLFFAEQNARLVRNAEAYYRSMFHGRVSSWNMRDQHMAETLEALRIHLERQRGSARIVVWEHNSHLGDARATEMGAGGELNVGQLARERYADDVFSIGFTTYDGTVTAASDWGAPAERKTVRPALSGSYEELFHQMGLSSFMLELDRAHPELGKARLERAIGVIYLPETERRSHYFLAVLSKQFDVVIHVDRTMALVPLEKTALWERGELPETYPTGL